MVRALAVDPEVRGLSPATVGFPPRVTLGHARGRGFEPRMVHFCLAEGSSRLLPRDMVANAGAMVHCT